jgi:hypothetical protein
MDKLKTLVEQRRAELHRRDVLGTEAAVNSSTPRSPNSSAYSAHPAGDDGTRKEGPTAAEVYDALQARVDNYNANMKDTFARCKKFHSEGRPGPHSCDPVFGRLGRERGY